MEHEKQGASVSLSGSLIRPRLQYEERYRPVVMTVPKTLRQGFAVAVSDPAFRQIGTTTSEVELAVGLYVVTPAEAAKEIVADALEELRLSGSVVDYRLGELATRVSTFAAQRRKIWYITVHSPQLNKIRRDLSLPAKQFELIFGYKDMS